MRIDEDIFLKTIDALRRGQDVSIGDASDEMSKWIGEQNIPYSFHFCVLHMIDPAALFPYDHSGHKVRQQSNHVSKILRSQFGRKYDVNSTGNSYPIPLYKMNHDLVVSRVDEES